MDQYKDIPSPFKLFASYTDRDGDRFFGRQLEEQELFTELHMTSFLTVIGKSSVGKSSLVNCGLVSYSKDNLLNWKFIKIRRKGNFPIQFVSSLIVLALRLKESGLLHSQDALSSLVEAQNNSPDSVITDFELICTLINDISVGFQSELILVFDQFEEIFSSFDLETGRSKEATWLISLFRKMQSRIPADVFRVVVILRSEFLEYYEFLFKSFSPLLKDRYWVRPMGRKEVSEFVTGTFARFNIHTDHLNLILDNLAFSDRKIGQYELPYVQVYLDRLYKEDYLRTLEESADRAKLERQEPWISIILEEHEIQSFGDIRETVRKYFYEEVKLVQKENDILDGDFDLFAFLQNLVSLDGTPKEFTLDEEGLNKYFKNSHVAESVLNELELKKIINKPAPDTIELSHQSLAEIIHQDFSYKDAYVVSLNLAAAHEKFRARQSTSALLNYLKPQRVYASKIDADKAKLFADKLDPELAAFAQRSRRFYKNRLILQILAILAGAVAITAAFMYYNYKSTFDINRKLERTNKTLDTSLKAQKFLSSQMYMLGRAYKSRGGDRVFSYRLADWISKSTISIDTTIDSTAYGLANDLKTLLLSESRENPFYIHFKANLPAAQFLSLITLPDTNNLLVALASDTSVHFYKYNRTTRQGQLIPEYFDAFTEESLKIIDMDFSQSNNNQLELICENESNTTSSYQLLHLNIVNYSATYNSEAYANSFELHSAISQYSDRFPQGLALKIAKSARSKGHVRFDDINRQILFINSTNETSNRKIGQIDLEGLVFTSGNIDSIRPSFPEIEFELGRPTDIRFNPQREYFYILSDNLVHIVEFSNDTRSIELIYTLPLEDIQLSMQVAGNTDNPILVFKSPSSVFRIFEDRNHSLVPNGVLYSELNDGIISFSDDGRFAATYGRHNNDNWGYVLQLWDLKPSERLYWKLNRIDVDLDTLIPMLENRVNSKYEDFINLTDKRAID